MSALGAELVEADVVDLFAGSGALGLEALSRGAAHVTFVEKERRALECLRANITALEAGPLSDVCAGDVFAYIAELEAHAHDLALADPPYGRSLAGRLVRAFERVPFARLLCVEHGTGEDIGLPDRARERRYGETTIAFVPAPTDQEAR